MYAQTTRGQVNTHVIQGRCLRLVFVKIRVGSTACGLAKRIPWKSHHVLIHSRVVRLQKLGYYSSEFVFTNKIIDFYVT